MTARPTRRALAACAWTLLVLAVAPPANAQPPSDPSAAAPTPAAPSPISASVDRTTLSTDDTLRLRVEVNADTMQLSQLQQPVFEGFAIVGSTSSSNLAMINGVPSFQLGYDYALQPMRSGDLVVPSFSIDINGQTYRTDPIPITVTVGTQPTVSPAQAAPGAVAPGERFFITAGVDKPDAWIGEQIVYTFRLFQAANLGQQPSYGAPPFTGFWQRRESSQRSDRVLVGDRLYLVTDLDTYLFPTRSGDIEIPPARLSLVGDLSDARNRLTTEPITVRVRPLPAGAPPSFGGAVGRYGLAASAAPTDVAVDEPVRLTLTLSGEGNVETAPDPAWPELVGWQSYDDGQTQAVEARDGRIIGQRTWRRLYVPSRPGPAQLPAVRYAYFDPQRGSYAVAETAPIDVRVRPASNAGAAAPAATDPADRAAPVDAGVVPVPDTSRWRTDAPLLEPVVPPPGARTGPGVLGRAVPGRVTRLGYWLLWFGPFVVIALDIGRLRRARRRAAQRNAHGARVHAAADAARREMVAASSSSAVPAVALADAVRAVLAAAIGPRVSGVAHDALLPLLETSGIGSALARRAVEALTLGDAAAWRPAGFEVAEGREVAEGQPVAEGQEPRASGRKGRTAAADADALIAALAAALARGEGGR